MFYRRFRLCITALQKARASGKAHTPCRAGVYSRRLVGLDPMLRREQAPALRYIPHYTTNLQRKQVLCRNLFVGAFIERPRATIVYSVVT